MKEGGKRGGVFAYEIVLLKESVDNLTNLQNIYSDIFLLLLLIFLHLYLKTFWSSLGSPMLRGL